MEGKKIFNREKIIILLVFVLSVFSRFLIQGITCNDEVQLRLWAQHGLKEFFPRMILDGLQKGRALGIIGQVKFLSYLSDNLYVFRTIELVFLAAAVVLMCVFAYKLLNSVCFSVLLGVMILAYIPVTFEPSVPNAFVIVITQPLILLLISLITWVDYLKSEKKKLLILSMIFFLLGMFRYEYIITYVLVFPIICFGRNAEKGKLRQTAAEALKKWRPHLLTTGVYLLLYVGQRFVFPSDYTGNTISVTSIPSVIRVLATECKTSFPGYCLVDAKYQYLFRLYNHGRASAHNYLDFTILAFAVTFLCLFFSNFTRERLHRKSALSDAVLLITAALYTVLPVLPNAITRLYQEQVEAGSFTYIPVSLNLSFSMIFFLLYLLWRIGENARKGYYRAAVMIVALLLAVNVQVNNTVIANRQFENYTRFTQIEKLVRCNYWSYFENRAVYAPSLYETRDSLAIEGGHWSEYASVAGNAVRFVSEPQADAWAALEMQDDNSFYLYGDDFRYLISEQVPNERLTLRDADKVLHSCSVGDVVWKWENLYFYVIEQEN